MSTPSSDLYTNASAAFSAFNLSYNNIQIAFDSASAAFDGLTDPAIPNDVKTKYQDLINQYNASMTVMDKNVSSTKDMLETIHAEINEFNSSLSESDTISYYDKQIEDLLNIQNHFILDINNFHNFAFIVEENLLNDGMSYVGKISIANASAEASATIDSVSNTIAKFISLKTTIEDFSSKAEDFLNKASLLLTNQNPDPTFEGLAHYNHTKKSNFYDQPYINASGISDNKARIDTLEESASGVSSEAFNNFKDELKDGNEYKSDTNKLDIAANVTGIQNINNDLKTYAKSASLTANKIHLQEKIDNLFNNASFTSNLASNASFTSDLLSKDDNIRNSITGIVYQYDQLTEQKLIYVNDYLNKKINKLEGTMGRYILIIAMLLLALVGFSVWYCKSKIAILNTADDMIKVLTSDGGFIFNVFVGFSMIYLVLVISLEMNTLAAQSYGKAEDDNTIINLRIVRDEPLIGKYPYDEDGVFQGE